MPPSWSPPSSPPPPACWPGRSWTKPIPRRTPGRDRLPDRRKTMGAAGRSRLPGHREPGQTADQRVAVEREPLGGLGQEQGREPQDEPGEDGLQLEAGQRRADAVAPPVAEAEMGYGGAGDL